MTINHEPIEQLSHRIRSAEVPVINDGESDPKKNMDKPAGRARAQKKRTKREIIIRLIEYLVNTP